MKEVLICSAVRTPLGSFGGALSSVPATKLGAIAIQGALQKAGVAPEFIQEVFMGNVCSANLGQAPARQAALYAGLSNTTVCTTINKVCSSAAKAIMFGAQSIILGINDLVVAGGMENMSMVPYYISKARLGYKYGNAELIDGLDKDGLKDVYQQEAMGTFADITAKKYEISREAQDSYAIRSYRNAEMATQSNIFADEIIPVEVPQPKGNTVVVKEDEEYKNVKFDKIPFLKPAFTKDGTVTAANASTINDGAAAVILASEQKAKDLGLRPIAKIISFADVEQEPAWFTTAPGNVAPKALKNAGLQKSDIDYFEVNEAFSVVPLVFNKMLEVDPEKVNIHGGAVALGHPLGASGARIIVTLCNVLKQNNKSLGLAAICNGGGGASSIIIERIR